MTMIRSIALAAVLGALVAAGSLYAAGQSAWRNVIAAWLGAPDRAPDAKLATEELADLHHHGQRSGRKPTGPSSIPISPPARRRSPPRIGAAPSRHSSSRPCAIPRNADIQNYIGYAYRRLRQLGPAMGHYQQALMFNPRHRSAHEHLGELYLVLREPAKAEEHLAALERICLIPCEEFGDLERAIAAFTRVGPRYVIEIPENHVEMTPVSRLRCTFSSSKTHRLALRCAWRRELSTKPKPRSRGHDRLADLSKPAIPTSLRASFSRSKVRL